MALRLLWINANPNPNPGGTEGHSVDFINALEEIDYIELFKAVAKGSFVDRHTEDKNKFHITLKSELSPLNTIKLIELARRIKPDFIIGNNGNEYINTFLAGKLSGSKIILFRHMLNRQPFFIKRFIFPNVFKIVAVSESSKRRLIMDGVSPEKIEVIPNFINSSIFDTSWEDKKESKERLGISIDSTVISFLGKVATGKGIYDFLEIATNLLKLRKDIIFLVVGYGRDLEKAKSYVKNKSIDKYFIFTGKVDNPTEYLKASDYLLVLSKGEESFGRVVVEGFATKNLVIVYNIENLKYLIKNGKTGFICESGDINCVVEKILKLSRKEYRDIVEYGYREFLEKYTKDSVLKRFLHILNEGGLKDRFS